MSNLWKYIVASSDWHLSRKCPVARIDSKLYFLHSIVKVQQLVEIANSHNAPLIVAGDIWDTMDVTAYMINTLSDVLHCCDQGVYAIDGQHDQDHRRLGVTCPYTSLVRTGAITHLNTRPECGMFGLSYGDTKKLDWIQKPPLALVVHRTITKGKPPFFLKDAVPAAYMLNTYPKFNIIISGDYHVPFVFTSKDGRILVNCGCLMRKDKTQIDYVPSAFVIEVASRSVKQLPLTIKKKEDVFNLATIEGKESISESAFEMNLDKVIAHLQNEHIRPNFKNIALAIAHNSNLSKDEIRIMNDIMNAGGSK